MEKTIDTSPRLAFDEKNSLVIVVAKNRETAAIHAKEWASLLPNENHFYKAAFKKPSDISKHFPEEDMPVFILHMKNKQTGDLKWKSS